MKTQIGMYQYYRGRPRFTRLRKQLACRLQTLSRKLRIRGWRVVDVEEYDTPPQPTSEDPYTWWGTFGMMVTLERGDR